MKTFMLSGVHRRVMLKAAVVHWRPESSEPPTWAGAYTHLRHDGRASKVNHPSPAHTAHEFPEPPARPMGDLRFK